MPPVVDDAASPFRSAATEPRSALANEPAGQLQAAPSRTAHYVAIALGAALLAAYFPMRRLQLYGDVNSHTVVEAAATTMALVVGIIALARYYSRESNVFLFIGTGFLGTAFLDGYHALVTADAFAPYLPSTLPSLAPWSWVAPRTYLAAMLALAWLTHRLEERRGEEGHLSAVSIYTTAAVLTVSTFVVFALVPLPRAYYPGLVIPRPAEFLPAGLFVIALYGFWNRNIEGAFGNFLRASLVVGLVAQVPFMVTSHGLFDIMFETAHALKLGSYTLVFAGLVINTYATFRAAEIARRESREAAESLAAEVAERREIEHRLRDATVNLEATVTERTADLEVSRAEALARMEEAGAARAEAEAARFELAQRNRLLSRANRDLEEFAYVASHDLQEPLRMVASYLQLIERRYADRLDDEGREFIDFAVDGATRMKQLIADLLQYSRLDTGEHQARPIELQAALDTALSNLELAVEECGAIVTHDELPVVRGDGNQLTMLLQNLIGNALKFRSERTPEVHIAAEEHEEGWLLRVQDNGVGIEPRYAERIFEIFQRLHGRAEHPGTGIGLAICRRIVQRHGGRIWLDTGPAEGATFCFTLPTTGER